jgi:hypothetical protein
VVASPEVGNDLLALTVLLQAMLEVGDLGAQLRDLLGQEVAGVLAVADARLHPEVDEGLGHAVRDLRGDRRRGRDEGDRDEVAVLDGIDAQPAKHGVDVRGLGIVRVRRRLALRAQGRRQAGPDARDEPWLPLDQELGIGRKAQLADDALGNGAALEQVGTASGSSPGRTCRTDRRSGLPGTS